MSNLNELFNKHSRVHPWAETDNKKTLDLEGLEAVIAEMMPSDEEIAEFINKQRTDMWELMTAYGGMDIADMMMKRMSDLYRSTLLGSDKNG
jgi:hypothetical protein